MGKTTNYKHADAVVRQIESFGLAGIEGYIDSVGCLMAGGAPAPWRDRSGQR